MTAVIEQRLDRLERLIVGRTWLTRAQVAERVGACVKSIAAWQRAGKFPTPHKVTGLYALDEVVRWEESK